MREEALATVHAGLLLCVAGGLAWLSGRPFVFPSLGPSAYLLATASGDQVSARRVLGGHAVGVLAGLAAYHAVAPGLVITGESAALAPGGLRLAASGALSVTLTTGGMLATDTAHAPACATTLIVSLGLLSSVVEGEVIMLAVGALFGTHGVARRTVLT
jgi:hypothetical protein